MAALAGWLKFLKSPLSYFLFSSMYFCSVACVITQTAQLQMEQLYLASAMAQMLTLKTQAPQGERRSPGQSGTASHPQQSLRRSGMQLGTPAQQPSRSRSRKRIRNSLSPRQPLLRVKGKTLHMPIPGMQKKLSLLSTRSVMSCL